MSVRGPTMKDTPWILVDTETTGIRPPIFVVEIGAQRMRGWEPEGPPFQRLLNQNRDIPPEVARVHGYTKEILERDGEPAETVYEAFAAYVGDLPLVAYNLQYDLDQVLLPEWKRLGIDQIGVRGFCALRLTQRLLEPVPAGNCKLQTLRQYYRLPQRGAHTALGDVETVVDLLGQVLRPLAEQRGLDSWQSVCDFTTQDWYSTRIAFGPFKDRLFWEAETDTALHGWLVRLSQSTNRRNAAIGGWYLSQLAEGKRSDTVFRPAEARTLNGDADADAPRPSDELARIPPGANAIIDGMGNDTTDIIHVCDAIRYKIGDYEFRETDYQQILIWAKATDLPPEELLGEMVLIVSDGAIVELQWYHLEVGVELNLSRMPKLESLFCGENPLTELDLSRVPQLKRLSCEGNYLTELDLSQVPYLEWLTCGGNDLTKLDLSQVPHLEWLDCVGNNLTKLDLSRVPNLKMLSCGHNRLTELDLSRVPNLEELLCGENALTELDLSRVSQLKRLGCEGNALTKLDLSQMPYLKEIDYEDNDLTELILPDPETPEPTVE